MQHQDKVKAIQFIRPNAQFILTGDDIDWLDTEQTVPTNAEIKAGLIAYNLATEAEAQAKATAKAALLNRLGITAEEAVLLLS
jgi:hypothetical protein